MTTICSTASHGLISRQVRGKTTSSKWPCRSSTLTKPIASPFRVWWARRLVTTPAMTTGLPLSSSVSCWLQRVIADVQAHQLFFPGEHLAAGDLALGARELQSRKAAGRAAKERQLAGLGRAEMGGAGVEHLVEPVEHLGARMAKRVERADFNEAFQGA